MSAENETPPAGGSPGDISEEELRKILGDDYDAVVGTSSSGETGSPAGPEPARAAAGSERPVAASASAIAPASAPAGSAASAGASASAPATPNMTAQEAEKWARQMEREMDEVPAFAQPEPAIQPVHFGQLEDGGRRNDASLDVLLDVKLPISVELGRTEMLVKEILECGPGTVIELNKLAGEPVDVFINGRMVAQGEVVVVDEHFGVRVTNLLSPRDRVRSLA